MQVDVYERFGELMRTLFVNLRKRLLSPAKCWHENVLNGPCPSPINLDEFNLRFVNIIIEYQISRDALSRKIRAAHYNSNCESESLLSHDKYTQLQRFILVSFWGANAE